MAWGRVAETRLLQTNRDTDRDRQKEMERESKRQGRRDRETESETATWGVVGGRESNTGREGRAREFAEVHRVAASRLRLSQPSPAR